MNVLVTGATGMIGGLVLRNCVDSGEILSVVSLVRRSWAALSNSSAVQNIWSA